MIYLVVLHNDKTDNFVDVILAFENELEATYTATELNNSEGMTYPFRYVVEPVCIRKSAE